MSLRRPPDWTMDAACLGTVSRQRDVFHPAAELPPRARDFEYFLARAVCAGCPVRLQCALSGLEGLATGTTEGVYGGLTPAELRKVAKSLGIPHQRQAQHGDRSRYVAGCRCPECTRAHATYEHERRMRRRHGALPELTRDAVDEALILDRPHGRGRRIATPGQIMLFPTQPRTPERHAA